MSDINSNVVKQDEQRMLFQFSTKELVEELNRRTHMFDLFNAVSYDHLDKIAELILEELRVRALAANYE